MKQNQSVPGPKRASTFGSRLPLALGLTLTLTVCAAFSSGPVLAQSALGSIGPIGPRTPPTDRPASKLEAARCLAQPTFGPTGANLEPVLKFGYKGWLDRQFALPGTWHRDNWKAANAAIQLITPNAVANQEQVWESFLQRAVNGPDQMRQHAVFALSQILSDTQVLDIFPHLASLGLSGRNLGFLNV